MKTVTAYISAIPSAHKSPHKIEILKRFIQGVNLSGDRGNEYVGYDVRDSDTAIIQGWVHEGSPNVPHLTLRKNVHKWMTKRNRHVIIADSNLFNYKLGKLHHMQYLRYSLNGVFPTTGSYFQDNPDPERWKQISKDLDITLKDWNTNGNHILICTQRNGGWSMKGLNVMHWVEQTVNELKKYTDRPIIVRGHPGDKNARVYLNQSQKKSWRVSTNESILDDFKNAKAVITYNSSPGVAGAIEGIPVFVTDPNPRVSQAYEVSNHSLTDIENPKTFDRQSWIEKLSMCHWKFEELSNGSAWRFMRNYI